MIDVDSIQIEADLKKTEAASREIIRLYKSIYNDLSSLTDEARTELIREKISQTE